MFPSGEKTGFSDTQWILKPGIFRLAATRGFINHPFLARYDPFLQSLRSHPRFVQLMERARSRWEQLEA